MKILICVLYYALFTFTDSFALTKTEIINRKCHSLIDFYQLGVLSFYDEAKVRGDAFGKMIQAMQDCTGKLRISYKSQRGTELKGGTVVFLPNGYVLTAGHTVREIKEGKSATNMNVITVDGEVLEAEVLVCSMQEGDWAILRLLESYNGPTASIGRFKEGDEVIMMGYPMDLAQNENHKVQLHDLEVGISSDSSGQKETSGQRNLSKDGFMYPIPLMGKVVKNTILLTIGADIISGYSGSPAFNLQGEVIGVLTGSATPFVMPFIGGTTQKFIEFYPAEEIITKCPTLAEESDPK